MKFLQDISSVFINGKYRVEIYMGVSGTEPEDFFEISLKNDDLVDYLAKTVGIYGIDENGVHISVIPFEAQNFYGPDLPKKIQPALSSDLCAKRYFLSFSTEPQGPTAAPIMQILVPIENAFEAEYGEFVFSEALDRIAIIPICMPEPALLQYAIKERKYVSLRRRYAEIRLCIPFEEFISGDRTKRIILCKENIASAVRYISRKDKRFASDAFLKIMDVLFQKIYRI